MIWKIKMEIMLFVEEMLIDAYRHYVNKMKEINEQCKVCMEERDHDKFYRLHIKFNKMNNNADKCRNNLDKLNNHIQKELGKAKEINR